MIPGSLFAWRPDPDAPGDLPPLVITPRVVIPVAARRCYRCPDCLDVFFVGESLKGGAECGACGGSVEFMGRVQGARLSDTVVRCACDGRCTGAVGPSCDCSCGGENHGTGRVVEVRRDLGPVPRVVGQRRPDELRRVAEEWRAALAAARDRADAIPGQWGRRVAHSAIGKARELRTHRARLATLAKISHFPH